MSDIYAVLFLAEIILNNCLLIPIAVFSSFVLTELIRQYTINNELIDIPNERSSHSMPTPRGGGLSLVIIFLFGISFVDSISKDILFALLGSGFIVAGIGFLDDHGHVPAKWRLLVHFMASFWVLYWLGSITEFHFFNITITSSFISGGLAAFLLVWLLNLFNFMDGIDGIAATEAIFVSLAGAFFSWSYGLESIMFIGLILAASIIGFLFLNWPPAKIFMGDVGSGFLGLMIGVIAYASILEGVSVWIWIILLALFLTDSGITLLRRILKRDKWYEAHCSHAYQHAARKWGHKTTTISVLLINLFFLFPMALMVQLYPAFSFWITLFTFLPLIYIALKFKAGLNDNI